jgi:hypothetical protein
MMKRIYSFEFVCPAAACNTITAHPLNPPPVPSHPWAVPLLIESCLVQCILLYKNKVDASLHAVNHDELQSRQISYLFSV